MTELTPSSPLNDSAAAKASPHSDGTPGAEKHKPIAPPQTEHGQADKAGTSGPNDMERIRALILGEPERSHIPQHEADSERAQSVVSTAKGEEYERILTDLRRDIDRLMNDARQTRDAMDEYRAVQREQVAALEHDLRKALEDQRRDLEKLSQAPTIQQLLPHTRQLHILARSLTQDVSEMRASMARDSQELRALKLAVEQYREAYDRSLDTLKRENRQAEDELKAELRRITDRIAEQKTDRQALAAIFLDAATKLETGYQVAGILDDLAVPTEE
ncbi:MAG: hypothetical protein ACYC4R_08085 [Anaerolineae bacterium]